MTKIIKHKNKFYFICTILSIGFLISPTIVLASNNNTLSESIILSQDFSEPTYSKIGNYLDVDVKEANSRMFLQGSPDLPVFRKTYELNWNVSISSINFSHSQIKTMNLGKTKIKTVSIYESMISGLSNNRNSNDLVKTDGDDLYPDDWYTIEKASGLNKDGKHIVFFTINIYPARYNENENVLGYITNATVEIKYKDSQEDFFDPDIYDLVIITPFSFKDNLTKLVTHKEKYNLKTNITTLEEIYDTFTGRDNAEQIKYFVKYAVEEWGVEYVLLVGEIRITPIRQTDSYPWDGTHGEGLLTDLYYADIYDAEYNFSSWDTNEDMIFGQIKFNYSHHGMDAKLIDEVDLYPDLHVGRLACRNKDEVDLIVDKIINYETQTYDKDWFKRIILAGGDTFPPSKGSVPFVYEGEITNNQVAEELPDFDHIKLWASKHTLNAFTFNRKINEGAGFVTYAGHGFEHGWATYRPNHLRKSMGLFSPAYLSPLIQFLHNKDKLPIIFFDACLTAKLDFNLQNLVSYYKLPRTLAKLIGVEINKNNHLPCLAWCFMIEKDGGAIGTIGATRPAYSFVDKEGVHSGAGYLDWMFFKGYERGKTLGEMFTNAQISYINYRFKDFFTIEEYILLGDPSLMVGGYPSE